MFGCKWLDNAEYKIMPGIMVLLTGIPKTDNKQIGIFCYTRYSSIAWSINIISYFSVLTLFPSYWLLESSFSISSSYLSFLHPYFGTILSLQSY